MNRSTTGAFAHPQQPRFVRRLAERLQSRLSQTVRGALAALPGLVALGALSTASAPAQADVILHAFNWSYDTVEARAAEIQSLGYKAVLVVPPLKSEGPAWWARYQPQDYRTIDHPLGNKQSFERMSNALRARGIRVYADILLNHMANESAQRSDLNYPGQRVLNTYASNTTYWNNQRLFGDLRFNFLSQWDFGSANCINNYNDVWQVQNWRLCGGNGDAGLPDLLGNSYVIGQQRSYLTALKGLGVTGFRIDAAKHMPLSHINAVLTPEIKQGVHVFGEVITNGGAGDGEHDNFLVPYLSGTDHAAYDFPLFGSIRNAFRFGGSMNALVNPQAVGQALPSARAVTFTVTHDIPNNGMFRGLILDPTDETLAYAYVLGRDGGSPLLYSDNNESGDNRWVNAYRRGDLAAMIRFHNATQSSDMQVLSHSDCHLLFRRGNRGIVGINKCGSTVNTTINMNNSVLWWFANYRDVLDANSVVNIGSSSYTFSLPARRARMWLR
ncbi:MAG: alpha-amylase family protein [Xanthomonadales bacterium]|nr:alpha-amylase family protein [Xanthomonadales bacterium]